VRPASARLTGLRNGAVQLRRITVDDQLLKGLQAVLKKL
jgi:hypothetical protein